MIGGPFLDTMLPQPTVFESGVYLLAGISSKTSNFNLSQRVHVLHPGPGIDVIKAASRFWPTLCFFAFSPLVHMNILVNMMHWLESPLLIA